MSILRFKVSISVAYTMLILGFAAALLSMSCTTSPSAGGVAYAQDKDLSSDDIIALERLQHSFRKVAGYVLPVVVEIDVVDIVEQAVPSSPFDFFFNPFEQREGDDSDSQQFRKPGLGSGVMVKKERLVFHGL